MAAKTKSSVWVQGLAIAAVLLIQDAFALPFSPIETILFTQVCTSHQHTRSHKKYLAIWPERIYIFPVRERDIYYLRLGR